MDNLVSRNLVEANGSLGAVRGDGIRVFGSRNQVHHNRSTGNAAVRNQRRRTAFPLGSLPESPTGNPRGMLDEERPQRRQRQRRVRPGGRQPGLRPEHLEGQLVLDGQPALHRVSGPGPTRPPTAGRRRRGAR